MAESNAAVKQPEPAAPPPKQPVRVEGTKPTAPTNLYDGSPQDRWLADQAARTANDPWLDPNKVLTRDPATGQIVVHEKKLGADGEATIGKQVDQPEGEAPTPDATAGEAKHKFGDLELTDTEIRDLAAHKAQEDLRRAQVPEKPEGYKLELPPGLKLPEGVNFKVANINDPIKGPGLRAAMEWAHAKGMSQSDFSELLGVYAAVTSGEQLMISNAARVERDALGVTGPARVDAILKWVGALYPKALKPVAATLATRAQVEMFEDLVRRHANQGGSSFSQRGREVPEADGRLPSGPEGDKIWNSWSYTQQKSYSEKFSQP
jgi:hypothetical protein